MKTNTKIKRDPVVTHEGGRAFAHMTPIQALRRSVMSCLLWEDEFYEDGALISGRIAELVAKVPPSEVAAIAVEARSQMHLRHVPLLLVALLAKINRGEGSIVARTLYDVIQRADELTEFLAIYAKVNHMDTSKLKISKQVHLGLGAAFGKFSEYALAKYNRDGAIKLRDVLRLVRPKPADPEQAALWKRVLKDELATPDTWEVALSAGADKAETFTRLIAEGKLGYLALVRNLRKMNEVGIDHATIKAAILARRGGADKVFPFRFIAAARFAPWAERELDHAMMQTVAAMPTLPGRTLVLVDVSGSMDYALSGKSDMKRVDAAAGLAAIINAEQLRVFSFSDRLVEVPARRGMAGVEAVIASQRHNGTALFDAVAQAQKMPHDRIIVITDEQANVGVTIPGRLQGVLTSMPAPACQYAYVINVASAKNGVGYGPWVHLDGFSENVLRFIYEMESAR